jgi:hypothetical protein
MLSSPDNKCKKRCPRCPHPDRIEAKGLVVGSVEIRPLPMLPTTETVKFGLQLDSKTEFRKSWWL